MNKKFILNEKLAEAYNSLTENFMSVEDAIKSIKIQFSNDKESLAYQTALIYFRNAKYEDALKIAKKHLNLKECAAIYAVSLIKINKDKNKYEAISLLTKLMREDRYDVATLYLGRELFFTYDENDAISLLEEAFNKLDIKSNRIVELIAEYYYFEKNDLAKCIKYLEYAYDNKNLERKYLLGRAYIESKTKIQKGLSLVFDDLQEGNYLAALFLGDLFLEGKIVKKDETLAIALLKYASDNSCPDAYLKLGKYYYEQDNEKLVEKSIIYFYQLLNCDIEDRDDIKAQLDELISKKNVKSVWWKVKLMLKRSDTRIVEA